jgi:hypothetical protein
MSERKVTPFNSALETGVRTLALLVASYPRAHDLHRLVQYDYLTVHSADADGPPSLHPPLPLRSNELLVRRHIIERGLLLMISRHLARRDPSDSGFVYAAEESAGAFLNNLRAEYLTALRERAQWVIRTFDSLTMDQLDSVVRQIFQAWTTEFQAVDFGTQLELPT